MERRQSGHRLRDVNRRSVGERSHRNQPTDPTGRTMVERTGSRPEVWFATGVRTVFAKVDGPRDFQHRMYEEAQRLWLGGWFVLAAGDCCFGRFKAGSRVGPVAERLGGGAAAATQSKRTLGNCVGGAIPIDRRHIVALDQIGPVLNNFDRCHSDTLPQCQCYKDNLRATRTVSFSSAPPTIAIIMSIIVLGIIEALAKWNQYR